MRRILTAAFALAMSAGVASAQTKWQMPTPYAPGEFHTVNITQFAEEVKSGTGGKLEIIVHPAGSLLPLPQIKRNVQTGDVQIGEVLLGALENEDPLFGVDTVPFLVSGYEASQKLMSEARPMIEAHLRRQGIRVLYVTPWPPQGFYSYKPLNTIEDLRGLKFRSYAPSAARLGALTGMSVSTIQAAELSEALNTGRINSMITSSATGASAKVWESDVKYYYELDAWVPNNLVIVNERAFQALDKATQDVVLKAAANAEKRGLELSKKRRADATALLRQNGMHVEKPSPKLVEGFRQIGAQMAGDWEKKAGPEAARLLAPFKP